MANNTNLCCYDELENLPCDIRDNYYSMRGEYDETTKSGSDALHFNQGPIENVLHKLNWMVIVIFAIQNN